MVKIEPPPPTRRANPRFLSLPIRTELLRIYTPGEKWKNTPISFRSKNGAIERFDHHLSQIDVSRGIHYSAESLRGCLVEIFGDDGILCCGTRRLGFIHTKSPLKLLDLRGQGAWRAGSVAAICTCTERVESQKWSAYFYEHTITLTMAIQVMLCMNVQKGRWNVWMRWNSEIPVCGQDFWMQQMN
jgi:hypothetical protein